MKTTGLDVVRKLGSGGRKMSGFLRLFEWSKMC